MTSISTTAKAVRFGLLAAATSIACTGFSYAEDKPETFERIEVTGSKIKRIGEIAPTPVTVITGDGLIEAGVTNVADLLHKMPNTLVGLSPETTNNTVFASGLNNTDLRGLGSDRTLVLVNGRRFVAGSPSSGAVDLNNIPTAMVERIEITTGGASAVYGSDAIAGVVNIVTKTSFDGLAIDASTTRPTEDGGEEEYASLTFGSDLGKANFVTNISWSRQGQISYMDREFLREAPIVVRNQNANGPNDPQAVMWGYGQQVLASYSKTGTFVSNGTRYTFSDDGQIRPMDLGQPLPPLTSGRVDYLGGEGYNFAENSFIKTPLDRINFFTVMNYDINDDHKFTMEANYTKSEAYGESSPAFLNFRLYDDNALLSPEAAALVTAGESKAGAGVNVGYLASDFGNRKYSQDRTTARLALGVEGALSDTWSYDVYATVGHVQADTEWYGEMFEQRFYDAVDVIKDTDGNLVCRDEYARANGCKPLNVFGRGQYDEAAYNWVSTDAIRRSSIDQYVAGASVSGDLFELPAGFIAAAFSVEYRKETAETLPDPAMREGLLFNNQSQPLYGEFDVTEASAELSIPLLQDVMLVQDLTLETAFRYMDYSSSGSDTAWKVGINWALNDDLRIRANRSKSVRAPNIAELYTPSSQTFRTINDYCAASFRNRINPDYLDNVLANCAAQGIPTDFEPSQDWYGSTRPGFIVGNQDLKNEVADDITLGFVYTPSYLENFSLTVDYWKFDMENVINSFSGAEVVKYCYQSSTIDNDFCPLLERDPDTHEIVNYYEKPVNSASSITSGFDIEANYRLETSFGDWGFRLFSTYLEERSFNSTGFADDEVKEVGEQERPRWRHRFTTDYTYNDFSAVLTANYRSGTVLDNEWSPNQNNYNDIPSYTTFDLTSRYNITDALQVRAGILNMFDRTPPRQPGVYNQGAYYDMLGQRITLGVNYKF
ncbi:TonB-dependent receptor plug domain-containing protein [Shewanella algae]|uniref:TonB-dependent receptor plug domain-containing protein n=2 Tax=Shewanella algae TaxID=38313 RepID=UPI001AADC3FB|nr:TonB-dependent receptor [Shewanella algae]MBO2569288.1 TonB-dependent receptor [Shewanella algae]MBO2603301.1 TonB-dependent receptor [Shewanella algae]MBO2611855.1 TonB-dependent receptor [Shewanella algae]MDO8254883.1 TonB-dependent receptor [Shewanella algae]